MRSNKCSAQDSRFSVASILCNSCIATTRCWVHAVTQICNVSHLDPLPDLTLTDFWAAWSMCQATRRRWLIADPLDYSEFELHGLPPWPSALSAQVEVDFQTRAKQSGGLRQEVFPDVSTSTYLQAIANSLSERDLELRSSLSAPQFGLRHKQDNPYDVWSSSVPTWIRSELAVGRTVVVADIRDYFGSVTKEQIRTALTNAGLRNSELKQTLSLIEQINAVPDSHGHTRSGIPVVPEEFFWLLADLVLRPLDLEVESATVTAAYSRWVDDLFLSIDPHAVENAIRTLTTAAAKCGFHLNESKTRVLTSQEQFEEYSLYAEHQLLNDLFIMEMVEPLPPKQQESLEKIVNGRRLTSPEERRLLKRIYGLARQSKSPLLLDRAIDDLNSMSGAEVQILTYLGTHGWPNETALKAVSGISASASDTQNLGTLRALLAYPVATETIFPSLLPIICDAESTLHPFCSILAFACLVQDEVLVGSREIGQRLLARLPHIPSATARRVGIELLWLQPTLRQTLRKYVEQDPSPTVKGLRYVLGADLKHKAAAATEAKAQFNWRNLDQLLTAEYEMSTG